MNEQELQQAYTRHCEVTGQTKMTHTGFEDFKAGFRLGQPAAGEPVGWIIDWPDEPELGHYFGDSPAGADSRSRPLYTAPPAAAHGDEYEIWSAAQLAPGEGIEDGAERIRVLIGNAAHGDEAVRKDAERYQALRNTPEIFIGVAEGEDMVFLKSPEQLDQLADNAAAMRAQAGEGGEV